MMAPAHLAVVAAKKRSGGGGGAWYESLAAGDVTAGIENYTNSLRNSPVTLGAGNVTKLAAYKYTHSYGCDVRIGLYKASDRSLVVQGVITTTGTGWNEVTVTSTAVSAGSYLLACTGVAGLDKIGISSTVGTRAYYYVAFNPLPDPLPTNQGSETGALALRAYVE